MGLDPGVSGGLSYLSVSTALSTAMPVHHKDEKKRWGSPIDFHRVFLTLRDWSRQDKQSAAVIEHVHAMPKQGISSTFSFGSNYGGLLAVLQALSIPYVLVRPTVWKRKLLGDELTVGKHGAIAFVQNNYPAVSLMRSARCRVPHDGMADAICLASYGQTFIGEDGVPVVRRPSRKSG